MSQEKMQVAERQAYILEQIRCRGYVTIPRIARDCGVSEMTMRRDLDRLAERGSVDRTHGGAVIPGGPKFDSIEPRVESRMALKRSEKMLISELAAAYVKAGQTIALDVGSTTFELARILADKTVNVFTTSLPIASYLSGTRAIVYLPGGMVSGAEPSVVGSQAVKHLEKMRFDIAFIGVSGISEDGFYDYSIEDTEIKKSLIASAETAIVLLDSSKFGKISVSHVCTFGKIDAIITDAEPPANLQSALDAHSIQVQVAQSDNNTHGKETA